ncbi:MAG: 16S rRNA (adenine(1518)-N(6)/adenine(1519)-N(6))-dimethyltransferase, partial [Clostridiales bacterium]|nr:16S rRNA (adenine(1518)-N(6)/adenine(1519)-N(6))-dimethyltransferase [Clostridiales bacterium]
MTDVLTPAGVREALAKHGLRPRKALGQNFLVSARAARMMIESLEPGADDFILEIGPGLGALTAGLAAAAGAVAAVEIDQSLIPVLSETVSGYNNVKIIRGDALRLDITELLGSRPAYKAAGSLPYYITGPILERLLNGAARPSLAVFLVQKEAAERFAARPGDPGYGVMSLLVQMNAGIEIAAHITPDAFYPQPGV